MRVKFVRASEEMNRKECSHEEYTLQVCARGVKLCKDKV